MQTCLFCNSDENLDSHHVCWCYYTNRKGTNYMIRSWKSSLVVPICRTCHDNYHGSISYNDFISKYPVGKNRENIIQRFHNAKTTIEEAIRLSYIIPLVDTSLCGKSYFYVKTKVKDFNEAICAASYGNVDQHIWGISTKQTTNGYQSHYTIKDSAENYDYIAKEIIKFSCNRQTKRFSKESILDYIQKRRSKRVYPIKFRKDEFDYALCRLVASKHLLFSAEYINKTIGWKVDGKPKRKEVLIYYYKVPQEMCKKLHESH